MQHSVPDAADVAARLAALAAGGADPAAMGALMAQVDALFVAHQDRVYALCLRFARQPELAAELAQDVLLRAYQKLPEFRGESKFSTWLLSIARYECLNAVRRKRDLLTEDGVLEAGDPSRSALDALRAREREELLRAAAEAVLDPIEQEAVSLRYTEHLPLEAITEILGLDSASGARGLLQRCKRKLHRELVRRLAELGHGSSFVRGSRE